MNFVSMDEVVAEAISVVGNGTDTELIKAFAPQWIWGGMRDLPVTEDNMKVCSVKVKNFLAKKPDDMRRFAEIALYDVNDNLLPHTFHAGNKRIYPTNEVGRYFVTNEEGQTLFLGPVDVSEDQYSFIIGSNGAGVDCVKIRYYCWPFDKDGMPLIRQEDVDMCIHRVRYMMSLKRNDNRSEIEQNRQAWTIEQDRVRARYKSRGVTTENQKTIGAVLNRMIPAFSRNNF